MESECLPNLPYCPTNQTSNIVTSVASDDCVCITEPCVPDRSVLMGSFHQGHARFGNARNRQCGAISLTALLMCKMKSVLNWEPEDLVDDLVQGTVLYRSMRAQGKIRDHVDGRGYIAVSELPRRHRLWNCVFTIDFAESFTGIVHVDDYDHALRDVAMPFDVAIQRTLLRNDACLLTICANTCAIVKEGSRFAFIDSHANGRVNQKGTPRFELTGVNVRVMEGSMQMNNASSCTMSSANCLPGYSDVVKGKHKLNTNASCDVNSRQLYSDVVKGKHKLNTNASCNVNSRQSKIPHNLETDDVIVVDVESYEQSFQPLCNLQASDDVIISDVRVQKQAFKPLTCQDQDALCKCLDLENVNVDVGLMATTDLDDMGCPCKTKHKARWELFLP
ncbi:uncharacterized protein LOC121713552 isoform X1 [Alosa sapidissima]|uniref:uncharacterized protein LOC121713552 isoform X1 n=1 Tax=Alosa sapidissima TaxID=34773 RepID=UPI001C08C1F7|nr:uncharacterized protein LOC121713552 isoform X1 [Alosa sapidissima]